jgi:hypothetical protein
MFALFKAANSSNALLAESFFPEYFFTDLENEPPKCLPHFPLTKLVMAHRAKP